MGANSFHAYVPQADADTAFRSLVDQARYEHGAGGYTGTIAEKDSYVVVPGAAPVALAVATQVAARLLEADRYSDKWGPAGAVPVAATKATDSVKRFVKVRLTNPSGFAIPSYALQELAQAQVQTPVGHALTAARQLATHDERFRTIVETVKGAAKIEYLVTGGFDTRGIPFPPALVTTLAAARQDVTERVKRSTTACEVRVTPTPLHTTVRGAKKLVAVTVDLEVEFTTTATAPRPIVGWLFFGMASS